MFTVATFNVNSINARLPVVRKWLEEDPVDVVCLQEIKCEEEKFPFGAFQELGYEVCVRGQKSYNGVAILSRHPFNRVIRPEVHFCRTHEARILAARTAGVWVVNTYIPQGRELEHSEFSYKLAFLEGMGSYLLEEGFADERMIWAGDLNVAMDERDVHDPARLWGHVCYNAEVQERLRGATQGMVDVFRKHIPEGSVYTFWDYRVRNALQRNIGWRIDHLFASPGLAQKSRTARVQTELRAMEKPSDHTAVVAEFDLRVRPEE